MLSGIGKSADFSEKMPLEKNFTDPYYRLSCNLSRCITSILGS
jgi:hypothetical protein